MLLRIWTSWFPPAEVKSVLQQVDTLFSREDWQPPLHACNVLPEIKATTCDHVKQRNLTHEALCHEGMQPEQYALLLIIRILRLRLLTGHYHLYGGVLTDQGEALYRLLLHAAELSIYRGFHHPSELQPLLDELEVFKLSSSNKNLLNHASLYPVASSGSH